MKPSRNSIQCLPTDAGSVYPVPVMVTPEAIFTVGA